MFNESLLWKQRFGIFSKETGRYLRYIFNGHLVVAMLFLLGSAAYYYQEWVKTLSPDFPAAPIMAVLISLVLTYSPVLTFLQEADKIFLLPLEHKLSGYFKKSILFSLGLQAYFLLLALAVLMPMYVQVMNGNFRSFFIFFVILILAKGWNLLIRWRVQYFIETNIHTIDTVVRYSVNTVLLFLLFSGANVLFLIFVAALMILLYLYYSKQTKEKGLKWEVLIEAEDKRMTTFYRLANLFTDVPKLKDRIKRRRWLDWLVKRIPYDHNKTFTHIYLRTFLRAGDYFGLFIRLTLIGATALYLFSYGTGQVLLTVLFLYLTGFQLLPLWNHHQYKLLVQLYPIAGPIKKRSFHSLLLIILLLQTLLFSLTLAIKGDVGISLGALAAGAAFSWFFTYIYSEKRLQT